MRATKALRALAAVALVVGASAASIGKASAAPSAPKAPTLTGVTAGHESLDVAFDPPVDDGGSPVTTYDATCTSGDGGSPNGASATVAPIKVGGLTASATYTCTVTATNSVGTSDPSNVSKSAVPLALTPPDPPSIGSITPGDGQATVSVLAPVDDGGSPITKLGVTCTSGDGGATAGGSGPESPLTVAVLTNGATYTCVAVAGNAIGPSKESAPSAPFVPNPPTGGSIAGTVTSSNGAPLTGYCAIATQPSSFAGVAKAPLAPDGSYTITGLPPGQYAVIFWDCSGAGMLLPQWYDGHTASLPKPDPVADGADPVTVTAAATTTGIDATLAEGGRISGNVTDPNGNPLADICVVPVGPGGAIAEATTDGAGNYSVLAPVGSWQVAFVDCSGGNWILQWWNHQLTQGGGDPVAFTAGVVRTGFDAQMELGGTITGTVTGTDDAPLDQVCVTASTGSFAQSTQTGPDGTYEIGGLPSGEYAVSFVDCASPPSHGGATLSLHLDPGAKSVGNVVLGAAGPGTIAGHITTQYGAGLSGACAAAIPDADGAGIHFSKPVGPDGAYEFDGLGSGTWHVGFFDCNQDDPLQPIPDPTHPGVGYPPAWFDGVPLSAHPDPIGDGATPVTVVSGGTTTVDECFGDCSPAITITSVTPGNGSVTVAFATANLGQAGATAAALGAAALTYTAACTSGTGAPGSATGAGSPLTVAGLTNGAAYTCTVSARNGRFLVVSAASATVVPTAGGDPTSGGPSSPSGGLSGGRLPFTGANTVPPIAIGTGCIAVGLVACAFGRRRRAGRPWPATRG